MKNGKVLVTMQTFAVLVTLSLKLKHRNILEFVMCNIFLANKKCLVIWFSYTPVMKAQEAHN